MQFQKSHLLLVVPHQFPFINLRKIKSSLLFCTGAAGHQEKDLGTCRVSRTRTIKITETAEPILLIRQQELQLKTKAEMPANCDTQVRKIEEYIKISNKKSKAGNIASSLNKWKEITSNKWKEIQIFLDKKYKIYFKKVQLSQL